MTHQSDPAMEIQGPKSAYSFFSVIYNDSNNTLLHLYSAFLGFYT